MQLFQPRLPKLIMICISLGSIKEALTQDTLKTQSLPELVIRDERLSTTGVTPLPSLHKGMIFSGRKTEVINLQMTAANVVEKVGRQVFAKIPGVFVYDMDGSGNQINISMRGLDPHRSWELNVRQNGIMINSDIYGYPASHYNPPLESIERIEIVRGLGALQYGAQFGGMINYITRQPDTTRTLSYQTVNAVGSFGLLSTFHSISGKVGKWTYYAYAQRRRSDGYRQHAASDAQAQLISLQYQFSPSLSVKAEWGRSQYLYRIPGPLTDSLFWQNPRQATRTRNFYEPDIHVPSLTLEWKINPRTQLHGTASAVIGARNSVQFIAFANIPDRILPTTLNFAPRQVDIDLFNSYTSELRLQHQYTAINIPSVLVAGVRYINNHLHRRQQGQGTTGSDYDLTVLQPFRRDVHLKTTNWAFFAENKWQLGSGLQLAAGIRAENGISRMRGKLVYLPDERIPFDLVHRFVLLGGSVQYQLTTNAQLYGGWAQAYRPVIFADLVPANPLERNDERLRDSFGHNAEIGFRGNTHRLTWDITLFQLLYRNRIGSLQMTDEKGENYIWKTNIGDSRNNGLELYAEYYFVKNPRLMLSAFTATAFMDAIYTSGKLRRQNQNVEIAGNRLEGVPAAISRNGFHFHAGKWHGFLQYSYVDESYSDPFNTRQPVPTGAAGIVPSYQVWDVGISYQFSDKLHLRLNINNLTNEQYFTKRPVIYPGAGVWNSDGRSWIATATLNL
ncbi:MAG: TonB-dependent receptor [Cytophagales bacterium]|nr:TonB-dependent receptor [Bernardetiaceae bacterium]MDW8211827.1 TonB-dependent receptor [Cytophagales bacterium]